MTGVRRPYTILYVVGVGHSGSTLLNLLLNGHSEVVGLCELHFLERYLQLSPDDPLNPLRYSMWRDVRECWEKRTGVAFSDIQISTPSRRQLGKWGEADLATYRMHNSILFDCISEVTKSKVLVDTSKSLRRLSMLSKCDLPLKIAHLVRDGRGVVNSYRRKYGHFRVGLHRWFFRTLLVPLARNKSENVEWISLKYEDLADSPDFTLQRVCRFAELDYQSSMLRYWEAEDVSIGGNRMRGKKRPVKLDEAWYQELSFLHRAGFALIGGWLNLAYGYPLIGRYTPLSRRTRESSGGSA
jgi:hypothetical protein